VRRELIGRGAEIQVAASGLDRGIRALIVTGPSGIGKTALASATFDRLWTDRKFVRQARPTAFRPSEPALRLEDWIVTEIADEIGIDPAQNATRIELQDAIVDIASRVPTIIFIDNAEALDPTWLTDFITRWCGRVQSSLLVLTMPEVATSLATVEGVETLRLGGLPANEAVSVLGTELATRFDAKALARAAELVHHNPQSLIYLRILDPSDGASLLELARALENNAAESEIADALQDFGATSVPFLALGRLWTLTFEERLLAWLWHSLGDASAEAYVDTRDRLVERGLLETDPPGMRIHPSVHIRLERLLLDSVGPAHVRHVDYYLSEYYRRLFASVEHPDMTVLARYLHHAQLSGNGTSAITFVLDPSRGRMFRRMGLALQFRPVLTLVNEHLSADGSNDDKALRGRAKIELAHCAHDLSEHRECLELLAEASSLLAATSLPDQARDDAELEVNYLKGSSYSNLGESLASIEAYLAAANASLRRPLGARAILSLGYLAFEMRFHDLPLAMLLSERGVDLAIRLGEPSIIAKNRCSQAQTLFFAGDDSVPAARTALRAAEDIARAAPNRDRRELGRILLHRTMIDIYDGKYQQANATLSEAEAINRTTGDRRRDAACQAMKAIALWREDQTSGDRAGELLTVAMQRHAELADLRNAIPEALTLAFIRGRRSLGEAMGDHSGPWWGILANAQQHVLLGAGEPITAFDLFGRYWERSFRPMLLEPRPASTR
jgi:tetratricopeptide (TPR) repeat protein